LPDGSVIQFRSIKGPLADLDKVDIFVPPREDKGIAAEQDIILGFIARITCSTWLILNVKEPEEEAGINTSAITDMADDDYQQYLEDNPDYPYSEMFGYAFSDVDYEDLTAPEAEGEVGYRYQEGGDHGIFGTELSYVYYGLFRRTTTAAYHIPEYTWAGQLWHVNGTGYPDYPLGDVEWGGYKDYADYGTTTPDGSTATDWNIAYSHALQEYYENSEIVVENGMTLAAAFQKTETPLTRFYCTDYALQDGTIIVKPLPENEKLNAFAVVKPGGQRYHVSETHRYFSDTDSTLTEPWEQPDISYYFPSPILGSYIPINHRMNAPGLGGELAANTAVLLFESTGRGNTIGNEFVTTGSNPFISEDYLIDAPDVSRKTVDIKLEYIFEPWEMSTQVKGGEYEITVDFPWWSTIQPEDDLEFDIDIRLYGSKYPTYRYHDSIDPETYQSRKVCKIRLNNIVDYDPNSENPNIALKERE
jgi:hypothetical protein